MITTCLLSSNMCKRSDGTGGSGFQFVYHSYRNRLENKLLFQNQTKRTTHNRAIIRAPFLCDFKSSPAVVAIPLYSNSFSKGSLSDIGLVPSGNNSYSTILHELTIRTATYVSVVCRRSKYLSGTNIVVLRWAFVTSLKYT